MNDAMQKAATLGQFLRAHRLSEAISQTELASYLGISKQRLCDIEHDRTNVSIRLSKNIAKKLYLPPEYLVKLSIKDQLQREGIHLEVH